MAQQLKQLVVLVCSQEFKRGIHEGRHDSQAQQRFDIHGPVSEWGVLEIVRNMCEMWAEGELSEEQMRHDTALILGWCLRACSEG